MAQETRNRPILTRLLPRSEALLSIAGYPSDVESGKACGLCNSRRRGLIPTLKPDRERDPIPFWSRSLCALVLGLWQPVAGLARLAVIRYVYQPFTNVSHLAPVLATSSIRCVTADQSAWLTQRM